MMAARAITTILRLRRLTHSSIVVMALAAIIGRGAAILSYLLEELDQLPYYFSLCQAIKAFINLVQCDRWAEEFVHRQFARLVQVEQAWNIAAWHG